MSLTGGHWHKGKEGRDALKSAKLREIGWEVIRIRDHGLGSIAHTDVRVDTRAMSHKEVANCTLLRLYEFLGRNNTELEDYLARPDLAMQSEAAAYIKRFKERKRRRNQSTENLG